MTALLSPAKGPDLSAEFWRLKQVPALVTVALGVRVNQDHWLRVQRARMVVEQIEGGAVMAGSGERQVTAEVEKQ